MTALNLEILIKFRTCGEKKLGKKVRKSQNILLVIVVLIKSV